MSAGTDSLIQRITTLAKRQGKHVVWYGSEDAIIARRIVNLTNELAEKIERAEAGKYYVRGRGYEAGSKAAKKATKKRMATLAAKKAAPVKRGMRA